jgi:hypothetical protein
MSALRALSQRSVLLLCESRGSWNCFFCYYVGVEPFCLYWGKDLMREKCGLMLYCVVVSREMGNDAGL